MQVRAKKGACWVRGWAGVRPFSDACALQVRPNACMGVRFKTDGRADVSLSTLQLPAPALAGRERTDRVRLKGLFWGGLSIQVSGYCSTWAVFTEIHTT